MGLQGVAFKATDLEIIDKIKEFHGRIEVVATYFGVTPQTIYNRINRSPEIKTALEEEREHTLEVDLDMAQTAIRVALGRTDEDNIDSALRASFYLLNNKGKKRGFAHPESVSKESSAEHIAVMQEHTKILLARNASEQALASFGLSKEPSVDQHLSSIDAPESAPPSHTSQP